MQQVHHVHLGQASAQHGLSRGLAGHLFERNLVHHLFDPRGGFLQEKGLFNEVFQGVLQHFEFFRDVRFAGHQDNGNTGGGATPLDFLQKLLPIHGLHGVVGNDEIGLVFHGFEQGIGAVRHGAHGGELAERLTQHLQDHGIIVDEQDLDVAGHGSYFLSWIFERLRTYSPLLPPDFLSRTISRMTIPLSRALHMS